MRYLLIAFLLFIFPLNVNAGNFLEKIIGGAVKFGQKDRDFRKNGKFCLESANHQAAIQACNQALKYKISNNDNANLFSARGSHFLELGKQGQALHDFNKALKYNPKHSFALNNRGVIKQRNADYQGALADYKQATRYNTQFEANVKQVQEIINSLAEAEKVHIVKDQGWCEIWKSGELVEQAECKKVSECNSYEICNDIHTWPSGSRTRLYFADTFLETINDIIAKEVFILGTPCALNSKTKNTFCFSKQKRNIKIATAEDQLSDRNSSSQHVAQDYEPGENEQEPEPEEFLSSPDNCFDILKSKSYDYAMENGCRNLFISCFGSKSVTAKLRKSEIRQECIRYIAAFAVGTHGDFVPDRYQAAKDLLENINIDEILTVSQKNELFVISASISQECLDDAKTYGYEEVVEKNKKCEQEFSAASIRSPSARIDNDVYKSPWVTEQMKEEAERLKLEDESAKKVNKQVSALSEEQIENKLRIKKVNPSCKADTISQTYQHKTQMFFKKYDEELNKNKDLKKSIVGICFLSSGLFQFGRQCLSIAMRAKLERIILKHNCETSLSTEARNELK